MPPKMDERVDALEAKMSFLEDSLEARMTSNEELKDELTWSKLKKALIERYGGRKSDNPFEKLKDFQQTGNVDEYITDFEFVSSQVVRLSEDQYLGYFIGGLKTEICLRVHTFSPQNRVQTMKLARDIEGQLRGSL